MIGGFDFGVKLFMPQTSRAIAITATFGRTRGCRLGKENLLLLNLCTPEAKV